MEHFIDVRGVTLKAKEIILWVREIKDFCAIFFLLFKSI